MNLKDFTVFELDLQLFELGKILEVIKNFCKGW